MEQVNACALKLAQVTVEYYEMKVRCDTAGSNVLLSDASYLRNTYLRMMIAQDELARVAEEEEALANA